MILFATILTLTFPILSLICNTTVIVFFTGEKLIILSSIFASFFFFFFISNPYIKQYYCQPPSASVSDLPTVCVMFLVTGYIKLKASKLLGPVLFSVYSISEWLCALIQISVKHWHRRPVISSNLFLLSFRVIIWMHTQVLI